MRANDFYLNGVLRERWNDDTRIHFVYDAQGALVSQTPYSAGENALADERIAQALVVENQASIEQALADSLAVLQAIIDTPNADMTASAWKGYVKDLARTQRRLIRLVIRRLDGNA